MSATIQVDITSANRFVNSLSKSLQALCHGCMDFDTEIEIVGYINVNIDCGSKVDYVLNEKVSKSTNNSMTFVSNSFLAKKDDPKSTKERSCSPIPELDVRSSHRDSYSASSSFSSSQLYRSSGIYSPHSQVLRGSQKRSWPGGDWRSQQKRHVKSHRPHYDPYSSQSHTESSASYDNTQQTSSSSSSFLDPSTSQQQEYFSDTSQSQVQVKLESVDGTVCSENNMPVTGSDQTQEHLGDVNIKMDPDALENTESAVNSNDGAQDVKTEYDPSEGQATGEHNVADNGQEVETEGQEGSQAFYEGDESASQFDIIEIDDEDEDIAAFADNSFGDATGQKESSYFCSFPNQPPRNASGINTKINRTVGNSSTGIGRELDEMTSGNDDPDVGNSNSSADIACKFCPMKFVRKMVYQRHLETVHRDWIPFHCVLCSKVFQNESSLKRHRKEHYQPKRYECHVCGNKFQRKYQVPQHIRAVHKLFPCRNCPHLSETEEDYRYHILRCGNKYNCVDYT